MHLNVPSSKRYQICNWKMFMNLLVQTSKNALFKPKCFQLDVICNYVVTIIF